MNTSIATVSLSGSLESKLRAIAEAGFQGAEIFENDLLTSNTSAAEVRKQLSYLGLTCTMFQPFRDFEGMPDTLRPKVFERIERKFDLMQELGTDLLLVCSNVSPAALSDSGRASSTDFRELGERAARRGLRVGYEALAWGRHVFDHRDAWSIVQEVDHPAIGLILDSFHSLARGIPIESLREIDPAQVFIVQLADAPMMQMDLSLLEPPLPQHAGAGRLRAGRLRRRAAGARLQRGACRWRSSTIGFASSSSSSVATDGYRSLVISPRSGRPAAWPHVCLRLPFPPRVHARGVEFVEFTANEAEVPQLEALFASLGFSLRRGAHRSKDVARWKQNANQLRHQQRAGELCARLRRDARRFGLRVGPERGGC